MSMRISDGALIASLLMLGGCGGGSDPLAVVENTAAAKAEEDGRILCALGGSADFTRGCTVTGRGTPVLTISHPDGGFRRFAIVDDGRGLAVADGAEQAQVVVTQPGRVEVTVVKDRYILPATTGDQTGAVTP